MNIKEKILDALGDYRCSYTRDSDGDALYLVDVLSPGATIAEGKKEMELLSECLEVAVIEMFGLPYTDQPPTLPTVPGWYWVRIQKDDTVRHICQTEIDNKKLFNGFWFVQCTFAPCPRPEGWKE